eukprot:scaffold2448_cov155-Amphora_coffeaeformis.AAC.13
MDTADQECIFRGQRPCRTEGRNNPLLRIAIAPGARSKHSIRGVRYRDSTEALKDFKEMMETAEERCDLLQLPTGGSGGYKPNDGELSGPKPKQGGSLNDTFGLSSMEGISATGETLLGQRQWLCGMSRTLLVSKKKLGRQSLRLSSESSS